MKAEKVLDPIVIDIGAGFTKVGEAGSDWPRATFRTVVGRGRSVYGMNYQSNPFIGEDAYCKRSILEMCKPVQRAVIVDYYDFHSILNHSFYHELNVSPEDRATLFVEAPFTTPSQREQVAEILFESSSCSMVFFGNSSLLCGYSAGRTSGVALECGASSTHITPFYEGHSLPFATIRLSFGGDDITQLLLKSLMELHSNSSLKHIAEDFKEKVAYVRAAKGTAEDGPSFEYELPDGDTLQVPRAVASRCTESLFDPSEFSLPFAGVHHLIAHSISLCPQELHREFYKNILLCGGSSLFKGLKERLHTELALISPESSPSLRAAGSGKYDAWIGGSILGSMAQFSDCCVSKEEYSEDGAHLAIHRKCF